MARNEIQDISRLFPKFRAFQGLEKEETKFYIFKTRS